MVLRSGSAVATVDAGHGGMLLSVAVDGVEVADRGLDDALAIAAPRRAGPHDRPVVLGDGCEGGLHVAAARHDDGGQAVRAPLAGAAAEPPQDAVHGLHEVGLVHRLGEDAAHPARMAQRAQQDVGGAAPGRPPPLEPVPLDLLAGRCSISMVSRPRTPAQASQRGRRPARRTARTSDWYPAVQPSGTSSSWSVVSQRCGSSAKRAARYGTNGASGSGAERRRTPGRRSPRR
jgi:hypothetical protein